jgi:hypothetical protein
MEKRNCCEDGNCLRTELAQLFDPQSSLADRVNVAACAVAHTCGNLDYDELRFCFSRLFEIAPECSLCDAFIVAYQTERDALAGKRDIQKRRAAGGHSID